MYTEDDLLPLSGLSQLAFCERRWALIHVERQWEENVFTAQGEVLHEKAHSGGIESRPGVLIRRTLPLRSLCLGLSGQADIVEFLPCEAGEPGIRMPRRKGLWRPYPVEYKRSRDRHGGMSYQLQLCAQALCLEEMLKTPVPCGAIFDGRARRRVELGLDGSLRELVEQTAARMHELHRLTLTPPPEHTRKCGSCSLKSACLPETSAAAQASVYLHRSVLSCLRQPVFPEKANPKITKPETDIP